MKDDKVKNANGSAGANERAHSEKPANNSLKTAIIMSEIIAPPLSKRKNRRV
ncbi:MAG: hypothetical protein ILP09_03245 [Oscillospiraceae bacterium]|nr:hypothetical protein [Oscillospiraceae bacterium]